MNTVRICKTFKFEAAHYLPEVPAEHKCAKVHGHSYRVEVWLCGDVDRHGWVQDFGEVSTVVKPLVGMLDHSTINDTVDNPTSENLAVWLWGQLLPLLPQLDEIVVYETATTRATYSGPDRQTRAFLEELLRYKDEMIADLSAKIASP